jgi:fatty-acid peroxygenase
VPEIPRDQTFDSTLALARDPYGYISKRCWRYGADLFQTRIMLRKTICMTGPEAAALFYDQNRFMRRNATPGRIQKTLFGRGGVQGLDDEAHRHRKQLFMSLMTPERIRHLGELAADCWRNAVQKWAVMDRVVLYDEMRELLTRAVCDWAGVPLEESEVGWRTAELTALFDYAGSVGPKHWWARLARKRAERWIAGVIDHARAGQLNPPEQSAVHMIARYRDLNGELLGRRVAAVELLNVLRPTVAVAVYIVCIAHALYQHPECRQQLQAGEDGYVALFVQEVRRFYPFFPSVAARVRHDFEWKGYRFPQGRRVMLDLYGTNHDARTWDMPEEFRPERFRRWDGSPYNFIPQGGGDHYRNHRCAGEWLTIEFMKVALSFLAGSITYDVPEQDLRIARSRLPALPRSHFVVSNVRTREAG